jgi:methylenetetrahydrofolate--tRNA-(uracil-5-)-methyltransferase
MTMNSSSTSKPTVHVVGAGLAGSECAWQLAEMGYNVVLIEMRDQTMTPAHKTKKFAELVCSNSFGSISSAAAPGQLKWEAEQLGSLIINKALEARVPAGQALGMDREVFSQKVTDAIKSHPRIKVENRVVQSLADIPRPAVIATGPLTHDPLAKDMQAHFGDEFLYFFDAIAPIIAADSINTNIAWKADRWDKGTKDYFNCPMSKREYFFFIEAIKNARKTEPKEFEKKTPYFESCMPIEAMIERGDLTPRFGPMSAKGLRDPRTGNIPFAVVQLRQENKEATAFNMVGFQTKMAYGDQKEVFRLIPGLEDAEFLKLGSIHRNLYIKTPQRLNADLSSRKDPLLFFAGQITGVEGYFESTCIGLLVARFIDQKVNQKSLDVPPRASAFGSLHAAITDETKDHFQPTNINFGLFPAIPEKMDKNLKRQMQVDNAKAAFKGWMKENGLELKTNTLLEEAAKELARIAQIAAVAENERMAKVKADAKLAKAEAKNLAVNTTSQLS